MVFMVLLLYGFPSTFLASTKNRLTALDSSDDSMFSRVFWKLFFFFLHDKNWTKITYRSTLVNRLCHKKEQVINLYFVTGLPNSVGISVSFRGFFLLFFSVSGKVLPVTPLLSGVFVHRVFCAYFVRLRGLG